MPSAGPARGARARAPLRSGRAGRAPGHRSAAERTCRPRAGSSEVVGPRIGLARPADSGVGGGREFTVPAGAEQRPIEEDASTDVGVDQSLAPARRVLPRRVRLRPNQELEEAEPAAAQRQRARCHRHENGERCEQWSPAELATGAARDDGTGGEIEAEQARERGPERYRQAAGNERGERERGGDDRFARRAMRARRRSRTSRARPVVLPRKDGVGLPRSTNWTTPMPPPRRRARRGCRRASRFGQRARGAWRPRRSGWPARRASRRR